MKKSYKITAAIVVVALALGAFVMIQNSRQNISIDINREDLAYIVAYCQGYGPRMLNYSEHQDMIDRVAEMVSGEYAYQKTWSNDGKSGGGPYLIQFYTKGDNKEAEIQYVNGFIAVSSNKGGKYYLYEKIGDQISFHEFEEYLSLYGAVK